MKRHAGTVCGVIDSTIGVHAEPGFTAFTVTPALDSCRAIASVNNRLNSFARACTSIPTKRWVA